MPGAIRDFEFAIEIEPQFGTAAMCLAFLFATDPDARNRDGERAVQLATMALTSVHKKYQVNALATLAAAYAEVGDFEAAIYWQEKAIGVAEPYEVELMLADELELFKHGYQVREI